MMSIVLFLTLNSFLLVSSYTLKVQRETLNFQSNNSQNFQKFLSLFNLNQTPKLSLEAENQILANYYQKFDKDPSRFTEERRQIILENYQKVLEHNEKFQRGETLFKMELNHFSDFTDDELKGMLMRAVPNPSFNGTVPPPLENLDAPDYWDWTQTSGVVQPVQNQGNCGSCYSFASIAAIEGSMCIHHKACKKLSEQEAMECTNGCLGGTSQMIYNYAVKFGGCAYGSSYPYRGRIQQSCSAHGSRVPFSKMSKFYDLRSYSSDQLRDFLYKNGPIYVSMKVPDSYFRYCSGIYNDCNGISNYYHAVLLVGYGTLNGYPYWIAKNSWGTGWGNKGFFLITRGNDCLNIEKGSPSYFLTA